MQTYLRGAAVLLFLPLGAATAPRRTAQGVTFTATTVVTLSPSLQQMLLPMTIGGKGASLPGITRIQLDKVENVSGVVMPGDVLFVSAPTAPVAIRPSLKIYSDLITPLQDQLAAMSGQSGSSVRTGDVAAQFTHVGSGEQLEGRATERYQLKTQYVAETPGHTVSVAISIDVWAAKLAFPIANPLLAFGTASDTPIGAFRHKIANAFAALGEETPLKTVITTALTVGENNHQIVQTTTLTDIKAATVDAASLAIPPGFSAGAR